MDWNSCRPGDEPARGKRNESLRRDVPHIPRRENRLAAQLRLLSALRITARVGQPWMNRCCKITGGGLLSTIRVFPFLLLRWSRSTRRVFTRTDIVQAAVGIRAQLARARSLDAFHLPGAT